MIRKQTETREFARIQRELDSVGSTNSEAFILADSGAPEGAAVVARAQTAGRGRMGRLWISNPGRGLFASVVYRPEMSPADAGFIPLAAGLAAVKAVRSAAHLEALLKWPNDVVISGKKVAGILSESRPAPDGRAVVVVGIGVNLNYPPESWPAELKDKAASLADFGANLNPRGMLRAFLDSLDAEYRRLQKGGRIEQIKEISAMSATIGQEVTVNTSAGAVSGFAERIEESGALVLRTADGKTRVITAGDVELVSAPPEDNRRSSE